MFSDFDFIFKDDNDVNNTTNNNVDNVENDKEFDDLEKMFFNDLSDNKTTEDTTSESDSELEDALDLILEDNNNVSVEDDEIDDDIEEEVESKEDDSTSLTADMLRSFFDKTRQRKYNLPRAFTFLEDNIFVGYYITPNFDINNYEEFSKDFDKLLSVVHPKIRNLITEKYGLFNNEPKSYSELSIKYECTQSKVIADVRRAIPVMLENTYYVDTLRKYFNFKSKIQDKEKEQEDIDFILGVMKELSEGEE